jgi:predicted AlkP superfamily phosphohydrolase/phosphomutase
LFPRTHRPRRRGIAALVAALVLLGAGPASAYIGPGAGVALLWSFFVVFTTLLLVLATLLLLPFRLIWRAFTRPRTRSRVGRLIIVGFDGQDPRLTERFMEEGKLPNFSRLAAMGSYTRLRTTYPSLSPTAWSSFATGAHPGKHNIYDFLTRDRRTYLPLLSSAHVGGPTRSLKIGRFRIPLGRPELRLLRKSKPAWTILGEHDVWSTVLRVPITFPPDEFHGAQLSAMCVPDLLGTQGTFTVFSTRAPKAIEEGGVRVALEPGRDEYRTGLQGPPNPFLADASPMEIPLCVRLDRAAARVRVQVGREPAWIDLRVGETSAWVRLAFRAAPGVKVSGNCRMLVTELGEHFSLYVSPLNIDPEKAAMPISHPSYFASYLAHRIGPYCTLGLAEDTWALNEGVIGDGAFLKQAYDVDAERERMLLLTLDRQRKGFVTCVFDATDRIQHMFWRYLEGGHPAAATRSDGHEGAIEAIYRHNDVLVGEVLDRLRKDDLLMVLSDHGFASFRRGFNPNAWLHREGYLALRDGADGRGEWLKDVDWSKTRAFAVGLTGIFVNLEGREAQGIVTADERAALKAEIAEKLRGLRDPATQEVAINEAFDTAVLYTGPYRADAPDLIVGYNAGTRCSWEGAKGVVAGEVFSDNVKAWSGDHCIDPRLVPGVLFASRRIEREDPALVDIAPTALELFGIETPPHMDGRALYGA